MTQDNLENDETLIEIIKNSFKKARTKRGLLFTTLYVLTFIFATASLILTVYTLSNIGGSESVESTRILFQNFGYSLGFIIRTLQNFLGIFGVPFVVHLCISLFEEGFVYSFLSMVGFSFIEAFAFLQLSTHFLDIFHDIIAFHILSNTENYFGWSNLLLNSDEIFSIPLQISIVIFITVLAIRVILYIQKNKPLKRLECYV